MLAKNIKITVMARNISKTLFILSFFMILYTTFSLAYSYMTVFFNWREFCPPNVLSFVTVSVRIVQFCLPGILFAQLYYIKLSLFKFKSLTEPTSTSSGRNIPSASSGTRSFRKTQLSPGVRNSRKMLPKAPVSEAESHEIIINFWIIRIY